MHLNVRAGDHESVARDQFLLNVSALCIECQVERSEGAPSSAATLSARPNWESIAAILRRSEKRGLDNILAFSGERKMESREARPERVPR